MRILIFGQNGQLAKQFTKLLAGHDVRQLGHQQVDFQNFSAISSSILEFKPEFIINTAAYTAVDRAETERPIALKINAEALSVIGEAARSIDAFVFHFSTDYVFDGEKVTPYLETDPTDPVNYYGFTKLEGERRLQESGCKCAIFRVSWIYGAEGSNFLRTILRLIQTMKELKVVADQRGAPTFSFDISNNIVKILSDKNIFEKSGLYHMAPRGETTWFHFAERILELAALEPEKFKPITNKIVPISTEEYKTAARRPKNSVLDTNKMKNTFGVELPNWDISLEKVFKLL